MDKNQSTGYILMLVLLVVYFWFYGFQQPEEGTQENITTTEQKDSNISQNISDKKNPTTFIDNIPDSILKQQYGIFANAMQGENSEVVVENDDFKLTFDSYGASFNNLLLKNYVSNTKQPLVLLDKKRNKTNRIIKTIFGKEINLDELYYTAEKLDNKTVVFKSNTSESSYIEQKYSIEPNFVINYSVKLIGLDSLISTDQSIQFSWVNNMKLVEKSMDQSRMRTTINYFTNDGEYDYLSETSTELETKNIDLPVKWVSMKQKFFNSSIITGKTFQNVYVETDVNPQDETTVKNAKIELAIPLADLKGENVKFYIGPNDYKVCKAVAEEIPGAQEFQKNVYLGWSFFATINKWIIIPLFQFLEGGFTNYGIIILILVFIVKTVLFPLQYKSYASMAKMKVLQPEMEEIKKAHGDNQADVQKETMKLYGQFGVSPLAGCIPMLAQMPVTLAMFNFFPNAIELRQKAFLWAEDLSSYDSILDFGFSIPMYGDHISLFTLLMTVTTIISTYFNNQMSSTAQQGAMKNIGYIMPVFFMVFLNNFSAGLTYYYFVSTLISIMQQIIIKNYFIDEKKIRAKLDKRKLKNKDKPMSKFQQRLEALQSKQENNKQQKRKPKQKVGKKK